MVLRSLKDVSTLVSDLKRRAKASSCVFFIRDPIWTSELHLVEMPGVRIREPMYGFARGHARTPLSCDAQQMELYVSDVRDDPRFRDRSPRPPGLAKKPKKLALYGDFVEREHVVSMVRFRAITEGQPSAILFVNFDRPMDLGEKQLAPMRTAFKTLAAALPMMAAEILRRDGAIWLQEMVAMLRPAQVLKETGNLLGYEEIAAHALRAAGLVESAPMDRSVPTGIATIHLYDEQSQTLALAGRRGRLHFETKANEARVDLGEGVISWVANRRKSIILPHIQKGHFRPLYIGLNRHMRSELAVPILAGGETGERLVGVLNIEAVQPNYFSLRSLKAMEYAASSIAVAHHFSQESTRYQSRNKLAEGLLELCQLANTGQGRAALDRLAALMAAQLNADECDSWTHNQGRDPLRSAGASYEEIRDPRPNGWTNLIIKTIKMPVWLSHDGSGIPEQSLFWEEGERRWRDCSEIAGVPRPLPELNRLVHRFYGHLGIPISMYGSHSGIAWIRYEARTARPRSEHMETALGLAAQSGLVRECADRGRHLVDSEGVKTIGEGLSGLFRSRYIEEFKSIKAPFVEAYVACKPLERHIGGDFYDAAVIDQDTVGILVGDGTNKGVTGALNMLGLMGGFHALSNDARYPASVFDRLSRTSERLQVYGTAIYAVITRRESNNKQKVWINVSSAGHPGLVLMRQNGSTEVVPPDTGGAFTLGQFPTKGAPVAAYIHELVPGDLLVLYTDGINEGLSKDLDIARTKISDLVATSGRDSDPKRLAESILHAALNPGDSDPDDMVVLVARILDRPRGKS